MAAAGSQIVSRPLRDSGYTFYHESMLVLWNTRGDMYKHTRVYAHTRTHWQAPKHAHTLTPIGVRNREMLNQHGEEGQKWRRDTRECGG